MTISFSSNNLVKANPLHEIHTAKTATKPSSRDVLDLPKGYTITPDCKATKKISAEELFDVQYQNGVELSDGSKLLRPVILSLGKVDIKPTENEKEFKVTFATGQNKIMSEEELISNRVLSRGQIKETENGEYNINFTDNDGKSHDYTETKESALTVLRDNLLYI